MILICTMYERHYIDECAENTEVINDYIQTKLCVFNVDKMWGTYSITGRHMSIFYTQLNIAGINSYIVMKGISPADTCNVVRIYL